MHLKKLSALGVGLVLMSAVAIPARAQSAAETKAYQATQDEREGRKQKNLIEAFLTTYPNSTHRAGDRGLDVKLMGLYYDDKNYAQMIKHVDSFALAQPSADDKTKSTMFTLGMVAAQYENKADKMIEFADKALAANPNDIGVLNTMARTLSEGAPQEPAAARLASLDKALSYAQRGQKATRPENIKEEDWRNSQNRLHGYLAYIYSSKGQFAESVPEYSAYLKAFPTDGTFQFRYGMTLANQLHATLNKLQTLNTEARKYQAEAGAAADETKMNFYADTLTKLNAQFEAERDITIETLVKAVAIGGADYTKQARAVLDPLYQNKHNSLEGLEPYIAAKRTEMAALAPPPPPAVGGPSRGGAAAPGGRGTAGTAGKSQ